LEEGELAKLEQLAKLKKEQNQKKIVKKTISESNKAIKKPAVSSYTLNFIKQFEGFSEHAYVDTDGTPVIGYGMSQIDGKSVQVGDRITQSQADAALEKKITKIQQEIRLSVQVDLNANQLGALSSLVFNTGSNVLNNSTLIAKLNAGDYTGAANEFPRWNKANVGGRLLPLEGLTRRRLAEQQFFLAPSQNKS
jgi:GH24 family phage-related lysozyme (muramidase)